MLTRKQLSTIGYEECQNIPIYLWNKRMDSIFKTCQQKQNHTENQTFKEFIEMTKTGANQDGTGRQPFKQVKQIHLTFILKEKTNEKRKISSNLTQGIAQIVATFFQIPAKFVPSYMYVTKKRTIVDQTQQIEYKVSHMEEKPYAFDVHSLFQVGLQHKQHRKNRLYLIQADLHEQQIEVDGRACGDGIAFITFYPAKNKKAQMQLMSLTLQTIIHQNLHTLGFDHCSGWNCLMNAYTNSQFWLCPGCLRKLQSQIQIPVLKWYNLVVQKLKKFQMKEQHKKGVQIIQSIEKENSEKNKIKNK